MNDIRVSLQRGKREGTKSQLGFLSQRKEKNEEVTAGFRFLEKKKRKEDMGRESREEEEGEEQGKKRRR